MTGICHLGAHEEAQATRAANPINIAAIDHVVLRTANLPTMLTFYCEVLGCRLERYPGELGLAQLRAGRSLIDLVTVDGPIGQRLGGLPKQEQANMDHLCLSIRPWDEAAILKHLKAHGVDHEAVETRYGARGSGPTIYLSDPDGNRVELAGA